MVVCTCGGRLAHIGPGHWMCRACRLLWDQGMAPGWLTMVDPLTLRPMGS